MKISVIMSTYNEGDGTQLKQAVDSILQQTFGEFEFISCKMDITKKQHK